MTNLTLERIVKELSNPIYDIKIPLSRRSFIWARRQSADQYPMNKLVFSEKERIEFIPLPGEIQTLTELAGSQSAMASAMHGELDIFIDTQDELNQRLARKRDKAYISMIFEDSSDCDKEELRKRARELVQDFNSEAINIIEKRKLYLQKICTGLTAELRDSVLSHIKNMHEEEVSMTRGFDKTYRDVEMLGNFVDISYISRFCGRILNVISFGSLGRSLRRNIDIPAMRYVSLSVLSKTAKRFSEDLRQDADYLANHEKLELSAQIQPLISFYDNLSRFASQGQTRMERLLTRVINVYEKILNVESPDVEGISKQIAEKMSNAINFC